MNLILPFYKIDEKKENESTHKMLRILRLPSADAVTIAEAGLIIAPSRGVVVNTVGSV